MAAGPGGGVVKMNTVLKVTTPYPMGHNDPPTEGVVPKGTQWYTPVSSQCFTPTPSTKVPHPLRTSALTSRVLCLEEAINVKRMEGSIAPPVVPAT
eukprot:754598-Hanusia_phi.AAC.1